jgi:DNA-binding NarL/FixJ family response regulator
MAYLNTDQPDVMLLDINLPDKNGIELCQEITCMYPKIKILALSSFDQQSYITRMIENGAKGYLLKNAGKDEILEAIDQVMKGGKYLSREAENVLENAKNQNIPILTRREKEVLQLIANGLTNNQIADQLFISPTTVDTHRTSILSKFEVKNTANLIRQAVAFGLI